MSTRTEAPKRRSILRDLAVGIVYKDVAPSETWTGYTVNRDGQRRPVTTLSYKIGERKYTDGVLIDIADDQTSQLRVQKTRIGNRFLITSGTEVEEVKIPQEHGGSRVRVAKGTPVFDATVEAPDASLIVHNLSGKGAVTDGMLRVLGHAHEIYARTDGQAHVGSTDGATVNSLGHLLVDKDAKVMRIDGLPGKPAYAEVRGDAGKIFATNARVGVKGSISFVEAIGPDVDVRAGEAIRSRVNHGWEHVHIRPLQAAKYRQVF